MTWIITSDRLLKQVHDITGRNVIELIDLPSGKPGRPSRTMTEDQAGKLLKTARGTVTGYARVVKASNGRYGVTHAATETGVSSLRHPASQERREGNRRGEPRTQGNHLPLVPVLPRPG